MRTVFFTLLLLIGLSLDSNAQANFNFKEMVGFGCGFAGAQTDPVKDVSNLLRKERYRDIVKLLDSSNSAEKYLAVLACEKLIETGILASSAELQNKIYEAYNSSEMVSVCSGCTYWETLPMAVVLKNDNSTRMGANYWLTQQL